MFDIAPIINKLSENMVTVISVPLIAALIGWITNYVAVKMIFHPRKATSILGIKIHGLIPRRQRELAESIGEAVARDLISHKDIQKVLQSSSVTSDINLIISQQIDNLIEDLSNRNVMARMFLQGSMVDQIKEKFVSQMQIAVPGFLDSIMGRVEQQLDFKQVVTEKIESFDLSKLEDLIYSISSKELRTIEILGGVLGFFVGLVQVAIMLASQ